MNELDNKILTIFRNLINSGIKYIDNVYCSAINYKINNKNITLMLIGNADYQHNTYSKFKEIPTLADCDQYNVEQFVLIINNKTYFVPELSRVEYAQTLDILDEIVKDFDNQKLDIILSEFNYESCDDLL